MELSVLKVAQVKKVIHKALGQLELARGKLDVPHGLIIVICVVKLLYEVHDAPNEEENGS